MKHINSACRNPKNQGDPAASDKEDGMSTIGEMIKKRRKILNFTQQELAGKLNISSQAVSKWENGETLPDIRQSKKMSLLYKVSLDDLIAFDVDVQEIQQIIERTSEEVEEKIDWTRAWGKKYPILLRYQKEVNTSNYAVRLGGMIDELKREYGYNELDALLVLKDILAAVWRERKNLSKNLAKHVDK